MPNRFVCVNSLLALVVLAIPAAAEPTPSEPTYGIRAGETMPFFVADFCHGEHKGHGGCPGVIISNHRAKGVLILARTTDDGVLALASALEEKQVVDHKKVLAFIIKLGEKDSALADKCEKAGLKATGAGTVRDQSLQTLAQRGLEQEIELAVLFLDRKAVRAAHLLKAGELTAEKRAELVAAAESWVGAEQK